MTIQSLVPQSNKPSINRYALLALLLVTYLIIVFAYYQRDNLSRRFGAPNQSTPVAKAVDLPRENDAHRNPTADTGAESAGVVKEQLRESPVGDKHVEATNSTHASLTAGDDQPNSEEVLENQSIACKPSPRTSYPLYTPPSDTPDQLLSYIKFHKTARACLLNPSCTNKPKVIIATCPRKGPCLGLGDRMRGMQFTFSVAMVTKRLLLISLADSGQPYPMELGMVPNAIDWTVPEVLKEKLQGEHGAYPHLEWYWCGDNKLCDIGAGPHITHVPGLDRTINFLEDDIKKSLPGTEILTIACRMGLWRLVYLEKNPLLREFSGVARKPPEFRRRVMNLLFRPSEETKRLMRRVSFAGEEYYSLHVRTGIDSNETSIDRFQWISSHETEVVEQLLGCLEEWKNATMNIFIASDSQFTKKAMITRGTRRGFRVKAFGESVQHYGKLKEGMCEGFLMVYADLFMLARGRWFLWTGSNLATFAESNMDHPGRSRRFIVGEQPKEGVCGRW